MVLDELVLTAMALRWIWKSAKTYLRKKVRMFGESIHHEQTYDSRPRITAAWMTATTTNSHVHLELGMYILLGFSETCR